MKYSIQVFGCAANEADSERVDAAYQSRGWQKAKIAGSADEVIIVTCMVRQSAEDRVTGLVCNLSEQRKKGKRLRIIVTGCMAGMAIRDTSGKLLKLLKKRMPAVDAFIPIEDLVLSFSQMRTGEGHALVPISNGCNNFCSYCVVPYARGPEVSRPFDEIISECEELAKRGCASITLLGQNVNSYGSDLFTRQTFPELKKFQFREWRRNGKIIKPIMVKHLGKYRIPTLFPYLLEELCKMNGITYIDFLSSNPWDFSDALIDVIAKNKKISRCIHLPMQSGDDEILARMNRWYTAEEYIRLTQKICTAIPKVTFSTDIIVGFPGETEEQFRHTVSVCKIVGFVKAYIAMYSDRPMTSAHKNFHDALPYCEKKKRWGILEDLINSADGRQNRKQIKEA